MRSAILQPYVPSHVFPTSKTTESINAQPGQPVSKRTASKSKNGSKRRASETGFDEFDDAGIDDSELALALAQTGGFESIDDFDDELRPNPSTSRKKQKTSKARDDETSAHEPRQLANGKWACNHNCKDKTSCKHLCCREGLDKKPKPAKAKTSKKKGEKSVDSKQTQLNLSVSKKARITAATQLPQSEQLVPAPDRNPPRGPEMQKPNALHNNAKSSTQPVPLLSTVSSRTRSPGPPVALPRPDQPRLKSTEAARRAAQNVYSDDFGDIDDMSLLDEPTAPRSSTHLNDFGDIGDMTSFDEPAAHCLSTHLSPPQETASDLLATDFGDMLDELSPVNKDNLLPRDQDEHRNDSSSYGKDDDMLLPLEQALNEARQPDPFNVQQGTEGFAAPFLGISDESAILELGTRANVRGSCSTVAKTQSGYTSTMKESHALPHGNAFNSAFEDQPASSDSAMKACMEELGTDFFNFTG